MLAPRLLIPLLVNYRIKLIAGPRERRGRKEPGQCDDTSLGTGHVGRVGRAERLPV